MMTLKSAGCLEFHRVCVCTYRIYLTTNQLQITFILTPLSLLALTMFGLCVELR